MWCGHHIPQHAARILRIDTREAESCPGVRLVLTGEDPEIAGLGTFSSRIRYKAPDGSPNFEPPYGALSRDTAQFVGDAVAAVFADSLDLAKDAAEKLDIEWDPLPAVTDTATAANSGVAQGIGQILLEAIRFDEYGQLITGSFMDYAMPRASDLPNITCKSNEVLTQGNPLGAKGAGEAGTVGALAAVVNAVVDALAPLGVDHLDMPITSESLWRAIRVAKAR